MRDGASAGKRDRILLHERKFIKRVPTPNVIINYIIGILNGRQTVFRLPVPRTSQIVLPDYFRRLAEQLYISDNPPVQAGFNPGGDKDFIVKQWAQFFEIKQQGAFCHNVGMLSCPGGLPNVFPLPEGPAMPISIGFKISFLLKGKGLRPEQREPKAYYPALLP